MGVTATPYAGDSTQRLALTYSYLWKHSGAAPPLGRGA